jgi:hypothetical protein
VNPLAADRVSWKKSVFAVAIPSFWKLWVLKELFAAVAGAPAPRVMVFALSRLALNVVAAKVAVAVLFPVKSQPAIRELRAFIVVKKPRRTNIAITLRPLKNVGRMKLLLGRKKVVFIIVRAFQLIFSYPISVT